MSDSYSSNIPGSPEATQRVAQGVVNVNNAGIGSHVTGTFEDNLELLDKKDDLSERYDSLLFKIFFALAVATICTAMVFIYPAMPPMAKVAIIIVAIGACAMAGRIFAGYVKKNNAKEYSTVNRSLSNWISNQTHSVDNSVATSVNVQNTNLRGIENQSMIAARTATEMVSRAADRLTTEDATKTLDKKTEFALSGQRFDEIGVGDTVSAKQKVDKLLDLSSSLTGDKGSRYSFSYQ